MFEDSKFCDEVIITASGEAYRAVFGKKAYVISGLRKDSEIWYSAFVPGDKVWRVRPCDTVPTGRRVHASMVQ